MDLDYLYKTISSDLLERRTPLYRQIYERLRSAIESGELVNGSRIPTNAELALKFKSGVCTVQNALSALEREGFIERRQGRGTFVKGASPRLSSVAIYFDDDFWHLGGMDYYRVLCGELQLLLDSENIAHKLFLDSQTGSWRAHLPKSLLKAADNREIQAVIAPLMSNVSPEAVQELKIPLVRHGERENGGTFNFDMEGMLSLLCSHLASQGCRSAGFITSISADLGRGFARDFSRLSESMGMKTSPQWTPFPEHALNAWDLERLGYESFKAMAASGSLPEGLAVFPDTVARGVIMGILESHVSVPADLKLVLHENEGIVLYKPFPAAAVVSSPATVARIMLRNARAMVAKEDVEFSRVPFALRS